MIIEKIAKSKLINYIFKNTPISTNILVASIRIVGNLATNPDYICDLLIDDGAIEFLNDCFNVEDKKILKEALWSLSNFFACSKNVISKILEKEEFLKNLKNLFNQNSALVKEELLYAIGNMFHNCDLTLAKKLFDLNFDDEILFVLTDTKNPNLLFLILELIDRISNIPYYEEIQSIQNQEMENETYPKYNNKVQNPLVKDLVFKGLLDALENIISNSNNDDVVGRTTLLIERLKEEIQN